MGRASAARMRDTPAAAATAAENSTAAAHSTRLGVSMCSSLLGMVQGSQSGCRGGWGLDAWMLGWFIRRLRYHSPATCFASGTGVTILDDRVRTRASLSHCKHGRVALACTAAGREMTVHTCRSAYCVPSSLEVRDGPWAYSIGHWPTSHVVVSDWQLTLLDTH